MARHRRHRRGARSTRQPDRDPPARQAQAPVRAALRRRRLRRHRQRGQGGADRFQAGREDGLPPLRLPGWSAHDQGRRRAQDPPRPRHRARRQGDAAAQLAGPADSLQAQGLRRARAPARRPAAPDLRDQAGVPVSTPLTVTDAEGRPVQTVGRRKEAIVRVRLVPGSGESRLNGRTLEEYFPNKVHQQLIREPFVTLEKAEQYDVVALLKGGGVTGQAGALRLGIARALIEVEADDRPALKKAGFLTRDPRVKERKKYGLKKARKAPQYSKR